MTEQQMDQGRLEILRRIDKFTEPSEMSWQDAVNWLSDLSAELDFRVDALYEEMEDEEEDA